MIPTSSVFVDTSAFYAVLDADDEQHGAAVQAWDRLLGELAGGEVAAVTHSSILVETVALAQRRLGMAAVRALMRQRAIDLALAFDHDFWSRGFTSYG